MLVSSAMLTLLPSKCHGIVVYAVRIAHVLCVSSIVLGTSCTRLMHQASRTCWTIGTELKEWCVPKRHWHLLSLNLHPRDPLHLRRLRDAK